jgi:2-phosphoglycerate kinase
MLEHELPSWRVLLMGGASGVGKTVLAHKLARHYGVSLLLVDDVRLALQQVTTPEQQPALHYFLTTPDVWRQPKDDLLAGFIGVATALTRALGVIAAHHLVVEGAGPVIIEGDGIAPSLVGEQSPVLPHILDPGLMRAVQALFVDESEEEMIFANMLARGRGFERTPPDEQRANAHAAWRYGGWLRDEAKKHHALVIPARPQETLFERALALAEQ